MPSQTTAPFTRKTLLAIAGRHRGALVQANLVALVAVAASVPIPLLLPLLVDEVLLAKPGPLVHTLNGLFPASWQGPALYIIAVLATTIALRMLFIVMSVWQTRQFTLVAKDITYQLRSALLRKLQRISMSQYEALGGGAVSSHFVTDMNALDEFIGSSIAKTLIAVFSLLGISAVLLVVHWQLALFIIFMNPLVIYFTTRLGKKVKTLKRNENRAFEAFQQALQETLEAIQQIRVSNREQHYLGNVIERAGAIRQHSAAFSWKSDAANRFSFGVFLFGFDTFRAISMLMVVFSDLSVGEMLAVFGYLWFMMTPVQDALNVQYAYFAAKAALGRINNLLRLEEEPVYPHAVNPFAGKTTVGVRIDNLSFAYGDGAAVLHNVSLDIAAGEKIALVGASGGGKSTLVQVLLGLYPANSGMIYFDGVPVTRIGLDVVRSHVATVLQQPALFNDSVRHNLTLGLAVAEDRLWQALAVAQLESTVRSLPQGLDTIVGNQGIRLSGGQRQRLAIARMVLTDPQVVILDESTSALDSETEALVHQGLRRFLEGRTTIIIAHRLSAVKQADKVYVFENGQIIESGAHQELLAANGLYPRLYGRAQQ